MFTTQNDSNHSRLRVSCLVNKISKSDHLPRHIGLNRSLQKCGDQTTSGGAFRERRFNSDERVHRSATNNNQYSTTNIKNRGKFYFCFLVKLNSMELEELISSCSTAARLHTLRSAIDESYRRGQKDRTRKLEEHFLTMWKTISDRNVYTIEVQCRCQIRFRGFEPIVYHSEVYHEICVSAYRRQDIANALEKISQLMPTISMKSIFFHIINKSNENIRVINRPLSECSDACYGELVYENISQDKELTKQNFTNNTTTNHTTTATTTNSIIHNKNLNHAISASSAGAAAAANSHNFFPQPTKRTKEILIKKMTNNLNDENNNINEYDDDNKNGATLQPPQTSSQSKIEDNDAFWLKMSQIVEQCVEKALTNTYYDERPGSVRMRSQNKEMEQNKKKTDSEEAENSMNDMCTQMPSYDNGNDADSVIGAGDCGGGGGSSATLNESSVEDFQMDEKQFNNGGGGGGGHEKEKLNNKYLNNSTKSSSNQQQLTTTTATVGTGTTMGIGTGTGGGQKLENNCESNTMDLSKKPLPRASANNHYIKQQNIMHVVQNTISKVNHNIKPALKPKRNVYFSNKNSIYEDKSIYDCKPCPIATSIRRSAYHQQPLSHQPPAQPPPPPGPPAPPIPQPPPPPPSSNRTMMDSQQQMNNRPNLTVRRSYDSTGDNNTVDKFTKPIKKDNVNTNSFVTIVDTNTIMNNQTPLQAICDRVNFDYPRVHGTIGQVEFEANIPDKVGFFRLPYGRISQDLLAHNLKGEPTNDAIKQLCKEMNFIVNNIKLIECHRGNTSIPVAYLQASCTFSTLKTLDKILRSVHQLTKSHRR